MKRTIWLSISAIVLSAAVVIPVIAQPPQGGGGRGPGRGLAAGAPFLRELNLTDAQREQIRALTTDRRDKGERPQRKVAELEHQLRVAVFADSPDQQKIDELKNAIAAATVERLAARIDLEARIAQILTPEQRAQARDALGGGGPRREPAPGGRRGRVKI
jgi:periplasmic protein CpxP/Spy